MSISKLIKSDTLIVVFLLFLVMTAISGCATGNWGRLQENPDVRLKFEKYEILPDHKYYYRGTFNSPIAIVGIHTKYQLNLSLWVPIDPKSDNFRTIIDRVGIVTSGSRARAWGFNILDQNGNLVGIWYSPSRGATVQVDENNNIVQLSPMPTATHGPQGTRIGD